MEETLGKRIMKNRKQLGLTQDQLAERLGVTAQAVRKWENDLSCPDIAMLPRLAEIFGTSTDALLGVQPRKELIPAKAFPEPEYAASEPDGDPSESGSGLWELHYEGGRKSAIHIALWILISGGLLLLSNLFHWDADFWEILWPTGLMLYGLLGLFPKFSVYRLACALCGCYFLIDNLRPSLLPMYREYLFPGALMLLGLLLLISALGKSEQPEFQVLHNGRHLYRGSRKATNHCHMESDTFSSAVSFGSERHTIDLQRLRTGTANLSFGELTLDLTGCREFAPDCRIQADCSFGELTILLPRHCRADTSTSTAMAEIQIQGNPDPDAASTVSLECSASFGAIIIQYI